MDEEGRKEEVVMKVGREDKLYGKSVGGDAGCGRGKSRLQINLGTIPGFSVGRRINVTGRKVVWIRCQRHHSQSHAPNGIDQK